MAETGWRRVLKCAPSFPERLDNELSFLSMTGRAPGDKLLKENRRTPPIIDFRITLFSDMPYGARRYFHGAWEENEVSFRIEFTLPKTFGDKECPIRAPFAELYIEELTAPLGIFEVSRAGRNWCAIASRSEPDPGDLPRVWVLDGALSPASCVQLATASNHHLAHLVSIPDIDLLRLPS